MAKKFMYLVDGHNYLGGGRAQEDELIELLSLFTIKTNKKVLLIFDNKNNLIPGKITKAFLTVRFADPMLDEGNADLVIKRILNKEGKQAKNYWVVSNDREIIVEARKVGAKVITVQNFKQRVHNAINPPADPDTWEASEKEKLSNGVDNTEFYDLWVNKDN